MNFEEAKKITLSLLDTFNDAGQVSLKLREEGLKKKAWAQIALMAAMSLGPMIYDYVVKTQAERSVAADPMWAEKEKAAKGKKEKAKVRSQRAAAAKKHAPIVNRRIKGGFKAAALGLIRPYNAARRCEVILAPRKPPVTSAFV